MKLVARAVAALAFLSFATPALPCEGHEKTVKTTEKKSTTVAKSGSKESKDKKANAQAKTPESRPATATN